jgi:predicted anti-sigma-YlaC factor YlaD
MATDTGFRNIACPEYEALLEDYLDGELQGSAAKGAAEHWKSCAGCREALEQATEASRWLRAAASPPDIGPEFSRAVMARIRRLGDERTVERAGFWQSFVSLGWRFAATGMLALGILLTYAARWGKASQPNVAAVRPTEARDLFSPEPARLPATRSEVLIMVAENDHGNH